MSYEKQTWLNRDLSKPLNDNRMNHIEDGIFQAAAVADAAQVAADLDGDTAVLVADSGTATGVALSAAFVTVRTSDGFTLPPATVVVITLDKTLAEVTATPVADIADITFEEV
jgi:predicted phosphoribosyltransferase